MIGKSSRFGEAPAARPFTAEGSKALKLVNFPEKGLSTLRPLRILLLEDSLLDAELARQTLEAEGFQCEMKVVDTREDFLREIGQDYDLVLSDYNLPEFDGLQALQITREMAPDKPFIFYSGALGEELATETMKQGATDYVLKHRLDRLVPCVRRALHEFQERAALKRAQEALVASEKLAVVGRLAATIAHEINNPLAAVTNLLFLIESHEGLDETARNYAAMAQAEIARVIEISRQTLSFYRESPAPVPVHISETLHGVLSLHERKLKSEQIKVEVCVDHSARIHAYPGEMRQIFINLIGNAIEALRKGGKIRIHVAAAHDWETKAEGVRVVIADNGSGIAPEHRRSIFEPFYTTKGEKGTGLGLWVTAGIIRKHHGSIHMRSRTTPGQSGTVFSIFLPKDALLTSLEQTTEKVA